jgi:hypothetical protein
MIICNISNGQPDAHKNATIQPGTYHKRNQKASTNRFKQETINPEQRKHQVPGVGVDIGVPAPDAPLTRFFFFFFRGSKAGLT